MAGKTFINLPLRFLAVLWASPYTLLGLVLGMVGLCTRGHARIRGCVIEFYGGGVTWLLQQFFSGELSCSLILWLMRRRPYRDNPFERQAYEQGDGE